MYIQYIILQVKSRYR